MKKLSYTLFAAMIVAQLSAQDGRNLWLSSYSRGLIYNDEMKTDGVPDTVTAARTQSGHALVDLGLHVQPNPNLEVMGMIRVRNDFGGFWGSGVTFDLRQLWVRGVIADIIRFQLGDIDYRMSPYTFCNEDEWILGGTSTVSQTSLDMLRYDIFQNDQETWRQQGLAMDFGFQFKKVLDEVNFSLFTTRTNSADFGGSDRLYGGGMMDLQVAKEWHLLYHYANLFDIPETSADPVQLNNPVQSIGLKWSRSLRKYELFANAEAGRSRLEWKGDEDAPVLEGGFSDVEAGLYHRASRLKASIGWRAVGANFRSPGAQTKRIRFERSPNAYQRYTNDQVLRPFSTYDLLRDGTLYNTQLEAGLMTFDPRYGNALPYGTATPNRSGVNARVDWQTEDGVLDLGVRWTSLDDIAGQGTDELRNFQLIQGNASLHLGTYFGWERDLDLDLTLSSENTTRDGKAYEQSDLNNQLIDVALEWEFFEHLSLLAEWRSYTSKGNDLYAVRDLYTQVTDFQEVQFDGQEQLIGGGMQYRFNQKIAAQLFYQSFDWSDPLSGYQAYRWSNWQFNFIMTL